MSAVDAITTWLETTAVAKAVGGSMWLLPVLSAVHVLGYTLVIGGALVLNLRWLGLLAPQLPVPEVTLATGRGIALGLAISIVTGVMLVSWKAVESAASSIFQVKMLLLVAATLLHFGWQRRVVRRAAPTVLLLRCSGAAGLALWLGLALAGCAYILLE